MNIREIIVEFNGHVFVYRWTRKTFTHLIQHIKFSQIGNSDFGLTLPAINLIAQKIADAEVMITKIEIMEAKQ